MYEEGRKLYTGEINAAVRGDPDRYENRHPGSWEVGLVVAEMPLALHADHADA